MRLITIVAAFTSLPLLMFAASIAAEQPREEQGLRLPYCVVDTGQRNIFDNRGQLLRVPKQGEAFFGQDGFYQAAPPSYSLSKDGLTVYDKNTGLTWQPSPDTDGNGSLTTSDKLTWEQAQRRPAAINAARYGGFDDWRLPSIKELYSLIDFRGTDPSGYSGTDTTCLKPFLDTRYFRFAFGDTSRGERIIDSQYASGTLYVSMSRRGQSKLFGVNFADGRIKGYDVAMPGGRQKTFFVQCVRGNPQYGRNDFRDRGDGTISDLATGLTWSQQDSGKGMNWEQALAWAQLKNREKYLGHDDWRLPTAKELHSIVDYRRSPDRTGTPAVDSIFACTQISNEGGQADYPCYWTGTTHGTAGGRAAVYVAFGRAMGYMFGEWTDVHGAGAQRSDPKVGNREDYPQGRGPQGDAIRIDNYVRLVRNTDPTTLSRVEPDLTPLPAMPAPIGPDRGPSGRPRSERAFHLLPRFAMEALDLDPNQLRQIAQLEQETRAALAKILTQQQMKILDSARPLQAGGPLRQDRAAGRDRPYHLIPPPLAEQLNLTATQLQQTGQLERETRSKLNGMLTVDQQKILDSARPPRPNQGGPTDDGRRPQPPFRPRPGPRALGNE